MMITTPRGSTGRKLEESTIDARSAGRRRPRAWRDSGWDGCSRFMGGSVVARLSIPTGDPYRLSGGGRWQLLGAHRGIGQRPVWASSRPELTALVSAPKSRSFWSAYALAKSAIAR